MNRRDFLKFLGQAAVGATVAYSFPQIIVPKNIISLEEADIDLLLIKHEIYPQLIDDFWFRESPLFAYLRKEIPSSGNDLIIAARGFNKKHFRIEDFNIKELNVL